MPWKILKKNEVDNWNEELKKTNAPFYQYPYFTSAEYNSLFSNVNYFKYEVDDKDLAFCAIIEIGIYPLKIGVVDGGPVFLDNNIDIPALIEDLKTLAVHAHYMHLQIRPANNSPIETILKNDANFQNKIFFPYHLKEEYDLNIYNMPEEKLLASFKLQCRRKIVLAARVAFEFRKVENEAELKNVQKLFKQVSKTKGYKYLPFRIFLNIFKNAKKYNLCDIYAAYLNNEIVNAVIIVKDGVSFYHLTSALVVKGFKYNESPSAKLHFFIMQHCFYTENKKYYNISFGGSDNLIRFKELFNPIEIEKPPYYTYVINKKTVSFFQKFSPQQATFFRSVLKKLRKHVASLKVALLISVSSASQFFL
ncbi:MAG: hypothetical protein ACR2FN_03830 [Chitinophagaceae bacterium]